ncbi:hypothetical protein [Cupriavidus basilensis]|uniref:Uncharacterized protein n=1 Tax=Cupriavidus basilensis TaxID=68895 RepID=A0A0C4YFQ5_9BURK|nr:hypothetical protein [Cupriavidus basilensis]AJG21718.1 hypothetical protein RR42_s0120 [Cupriavidus basilensis]
MAVRSPALEEIVSDENHRFGIREHKGNASARSFAHWTRGTLDKLFAMPVNASTLLPEQEQATK